MTPKDVRSFRDAERGLGKSPVTANLAHKTIAAALGAAVKMGYIPTKPALAVDHLSTHEERAQKETFTPEEIAKLLQAAPSGDWRGVILLGAFAGMRLGDALRLKWGNVDLQAGAITFTPSKTARLGKKLPCQSILKSKPFCSSTQPGQVMRLRYFPPLRIFRFQASRARAWPLDASWSVQESPPESPAKPKTAAPGGTSRRGASTACDIVS